MSTTVSDDVPSTAVDRQKEMTYAAFYGAPMTSSRGVADRSSNAISSNGAGSRRGTGGAAAGRDRDDDTIAGYCPRSSCGKRVYVPRGFDLKLVDCPHCRQTMG